MTQAPIGPDLDEPLNVHLLLAAQIALDLIVLGDELANSGHLRFGEILDACVRTHPSGCEDLGGARGTDAKQVRQADFGTLVSGQVNTFDSGHGSPILAAACASGSRR
jgi:hypothetical protein